MSKYRKPSNKSARDASTDGETLLPAFARCVYCGRDIQPVVVWTSGVIDWEENGDSGCFDSPDTVLKGPDAGTGGHVPVGAA